MENNKYLLITGASSGIGKELAVNFSKTHNLILCGRNKDRLEQVKALCSEEHTQKIWAFDLDKIDCVEQSLKEFMKQHNLQIEFFVHCAGVMKQLPCKMFSPEYFINAYNVNVIAAAMVMKVLVSKRINGTMLRSAVFISSNISNYGAKTFSTYASSKAALDGLMRCLAIELAPQVRVNSVLPGGIRTNMTAEIFQDKEISVRMQNQYPLGVGEPKDIFGAVEFLLSEQASWITGQQFVVDGGRNINLTE